MFRKTPLVEIELAYLRKTRPHRVRHYFLLGLALLVALAPLFHIFTRNDGTLVQGIAFVILIVYWFVQWLIMKTAVVSANYELPDEMLGSYSNRELISAKLWAILRHYWVIIMLVSLAALGLSLALMGYFHRIPVPYAQNNPILDDLGLLRYLSFSPELQDAIREGDYIFVPHFLQIALTTGVLLSFSLINTILTMSFGLWNKHSYQAPSLRFCLALVMICAFLALFSARYYSFESSVPLQAWHCIWGNIKDDNYCQNISHQHSIIRILESLQISTLSFLDGGSSLTSALLQPTGHNFQIYYDESGNERIQTLPTTIGNTFSLMGFEWRCYGVAVVTMLSQLTLSGFLLWRTSRSMGKKKK